MENNLMDKISFPKAIRSLEKYQVNNVVLTINSMSCDVESLTISPDKILISYEVDGGELGKIAQTLTIDDTCNVWLGKKDLTFNRGTFWRKTGNKIQREAGFRLTIEVEF